MEAWDSAPMEMAMEERVEGQTGIYINGGFVALSPDVPFAAAIKEAAGNARYGKYRVFVNGEEISPTACPSAFAEGMTAEVVPFDNPGTN